MSKKQDLALLRKSKRKGPKRFKGVTMSRLRPGFPTSLAASVAVWDDLFKLCEWIEAMPDWLDLDDHTWDNVREKQYGPVEDLLVTYGLAENNTLQCCGVETEGKHLIALLETDESLEAGEPEHRCRILRGRK